MTRCSICHTLVVASEPTETCPECDQTYHASCWTELGGCATYGCSKAPAAEKPKPPPHVGSGWGDEKQCPSCQRAILSSVLLCRCGARFPYADPMTRQEWQRWTETQRSAKAARKALLVLFLLSLLGPLAPLLGPIAGAFAWSKRRLLAGAEGTYLAMGYGAAALGVTQIVVLVCLLLGR